MDEDSHACTHTDMLITAVKEKGNMIFQPKFISWSYLYRGKIARTKIKKNANTTIFAIKIISYETN